MALIYVSACLMMVHLASGLEPLAAVLVARGRARRVLVRPFPEAHPTSRTQLTSLAMSRAAVGFVDDAEGQGASLEALVRNIAVSSTFLTQMVRAPGGKGVPG